MNADHDTLMQVHWDNRCGYRYQATCSCGYRGAYLPDQGRIPEFIREHQRRMAGEDVTVR